MIRRLLADYLIFLFGEDLQKEPQRLETLVDVLEFFYTQWSNNGAKTASLQVKEGGNGRFHVVLALVLRVCWTTNKQTKDILAIFFFRYPFTLNTRMHKNYLTFLRTVIWGKFEIGWWWWWWWW